MGMKFLGFGRMINAQNMELIPGLTEKYTKEILTKTVSQTGMVHCYFQTGTNMLVTFGKESKVDTVS